MRWILALPLLLAACDGPSPRYSGQVAREVAVGQARFVVRQRGGEAEAIRVSPGMPEDLRGTVLRGLLAIETATGCGVRPGRWSGDAAVIRAALDCGQARPSETMLDCTVVGTWPIKVLGERVEEIECGIVAR
jgi:hypothetical protein